LEFRKADGIIYETLDVGKNYDRNKVNLLFSSESWPNYPKLKKAFDFMGYKFDISVNYHLPNDEVVLEQTRLAQLEVDKALAYSFIR
jgi:hypothetical protein